MRHRAAQVKKEEDMEVDGQHSDGASSADDDNILDEFDTADSDTEMCQLVK